MPGFDGTGPGGMGPMTGGGRGLCSPLGRGATAPRGLGVRRGGGFGFRGSSPPWPYVGRGRGGLPRCGYFYEAPGYTPHYGADAPQPTTDQELDFLKSEANAVKEQLEQIEAKIRDMEEAKESLL